MSFENIDAHDLGDYDLIRVLNFCECEFGAYGKFEINNKEGLLNIIDDFEFTLEEIVDLLYKNISLKKDDKFLYYDNGQRWLYSVDKEFLLNEFDKNIPKHLCNGELREMLNEYFDIDLN